MSFALREMGAAFRRTPLLVMLSVVAIGFSLFVVGLFTLTAFNVKRALEQIEERVEVVAYLRDSADSAQIAIARAELAQLPEIASVRFVSKDEALANAARDLVEFREAFSDLEVNPLPASFEVRMRPGNRTPAAVERVAENLRGYSFVEDVRFGREWLDKLVSLRKVFAGTAVVIGGAFAAVAAIIIASAVRIAVFARREEISIMRLVGATNGFIQRPFLLEGLFAGTLGGCLAVLLTFATFQYVNRALYQIAWLPPEWTLGGLLVGAGFGLVASAVAVRRHLGAV